LGDYIGRAIETGQRTPMDVLSIILMRSKAVVWMEARPTTWTTYNEILKRCNENPPGDHGCYLPALAAAETLLNRSCHGNCALVLNVLTDGVPSDGREGLEPGSVDALKGYAMGRSNIRDAVARISAKFGRRLTVSVIGMGHLKDPSVVKEVTDVASDHGAMAKFQLPSSNVEGIEEAFGVVATSLTDTKTEMTDVPGGIQRKVRQVVREPKSGIVVPIKTVNPDESVIYEGHEIIRIEYDPNHPKKFRDAIATDSKAYGFAHLIKPFGEGAERLAYRCVDVQEDCKTVAGNRQFVMKTSRFEDADQWKETGERFVKKYALTQNIAKNMAEEFNRRLDEMPRLDPKTPRITFLDCSVLYLTKMGKQKSVIVEPLVLGDFHKWNNNNGVSFLFFFVMPYYVVITP